MHIAIVHNFYLQRGGEDVVVEQEVELLRAAGHQVSTFFTHNQSLQGLPGWKQLGLLLWNQGERRRFCSWLQAQKCQIVHLHNSFPYLSPSILSIPHRLGLPLVVTLHNYRLVCPAATLFRAGRVCTLCLRNFGLWAAVRHRCYRASSWASLAVVALLSWQRFSRVWQRQVDRFFLFHPLQQQLLQAARLDPRKIILKTNAVESAMDRELPAQLDQLPIDFLVAGRLSAEKGIVELAQWWSKQSFPYRLTVVGGGEEPACRQLQQLAAQDQRICFPGQVSKSQLAGLMQQSRFLIFPSLWYEGMPMVMLEAFAQGLPILARRLGAAQFLVQENQRGFFFHTNADLLTQLNLLAQIPREHYQQLCQNCQQWQREHASPATNLNQLESCYRQILSKRQA